MRILTVVAGLLFMEIKPLQMDSITMITCQGSLQDAYPANDKDVVKRTMLKHEAILGNRIQRDLMDEIKRKELKNRLPVETSFSSSPLASQIICVGVEDIHSPLSSMKGSSAQASPLPSQNGGTSKDVEILESRAIKGEKKNV
ncbi:hypothetical protein NC651_024951 [Populus alba x Populus x berolinensis]|nr:hypothetical protein NC651_024951 [Populus alba x Populus x berolinensis]